MIVKRRSTLTALQGEFIVAFAPQLRGVVFHLTPFEGYKLLTKQLRVTERLSQNNLYETGGERRKKKTF